MGNAKNRLLSFLKFLKMGQNAFEEKVGISRSYLSNNKGSIGSDVINKIYEAYPELNLEWLIAGKGEMLKNGITPAKSDDLTTKNDIYREKYYDLLEKYTQKLETNEQLRIDIKYLETELSEVKRQAF